MPSNENKFDPNFMMEALMNEMERMMIEEMDQIHERLDQIESNQEDQPRNTTDGHQRKKVHSKKIDLEMMNLIMKALMKLMIEIYVNPIREVL